MKLEVERFVLEGRQTYGIDGASQRDIVSQDPTLVPIPKFNCGQETSVAEYAALFESSAEQNNSAEEPRPLALTAVVAGIKLKQIALRGGS